MTSVAFTKMTCLAKSGETGNSIHSNSDFHSFHGSSDMYGCVSIKKLKKIENNFFPIFLPPRGTNAHPFEGLYLGLGGEIQKSPRWRHLYCHKLQTATQHAPVALMV